MSGRLGDLVRAPYVADSPDSRALPLPCPARLCSRKSEREGTRDLNDLKTLGPVVPNTSLLIWALVWVPGQTFKFILAFAFYVLENDITNVYTGHLKSMSCERLSGGMDFFQRPSSLKISKFFHNHYSFLRAQEPSQAGPALWSWPRLRKVRPYSQVRFAEAPKAVSLQTQLSSSPPALSTPEQTFSPDAAWGCHWDL